MAITLTKSLRAKLNETEFRKADLRFARRIRAFRPEPVKRVSDHQLAEIVRCSRTAARRFGIQDNKLVARFVMVDALIAPKFYETDDFAAHFRNASGTADIKAGDIFRLIALTMRTYGRSNEVWW